MNIVRSNNLNRDFQELVSLLDKELTGQYGDLQNEYNKFNKIDFLDTVVIGYIDNFPAGSGCFKVYDNSTVEIKRMFVRPEMRGSGIASMILQELEKWAAEKGFTNVVLETGIKQHEAIRFYTKLGYHQIDNYRQYIGNSNSICMARKLMPE